MRPPLSITDLENEDGAGRLLDERGLEFDDAVPSIDNPVPGRRIAMD
jgi:hypothetical protein